MYSLKKKKEVLDYIIDNEFFIDIYEYFVKICRTIFLDIKPFPPYNRYTDIFSKRLKFL